MTKPFSRLRRKMLRSPAVRAAYEQLAPEFDLARELISARARAGLSQAQVARRMKTTQSAIARIESGRHWPSRRTLERYARATNTRPVIRLIAAG
jgi:ribosome-binding protein aMBF1 (putative translation factor)